MNCEDTKTAYWIIAVLGFVFVILGFASSKAVAVYIGQELHVGVTFQKTISGTLQEMGVKIDPSDRVVIKPAGFVVSNMDSTFRSGEKIEFEKANPVIIQFDGMRKQILCTRKNLRNAVSKIGIKLGPLDRVQVSEDPYRPGAMLTRVVRVEHKLVKRKERIPYEIDYVPNNQVHQGKVAVWKLGSGGEREDLYREIYEDGKLVTSTFISTRISHRPIHEEMAIGEAEMPGGAIEKILVEATAYSPTVAECDADPWTTATGMRSGYGIIAVDPTVIPYYTKVYVEGYGYAIAGDCGGAIKNNIIDVFFYKPEEAMRWGRRKVNLYVLEWPKRSQR